MLNAITVIEPAPRVLLAYQMLHGQFATVINETSPVYKHILLCLTTGSIVDLTTGNVLVNDAVTVKLIPVGSTLTLKVGAGIDLSLQQKAMLRQIRDDSNKLEAIKRLREWTNAGLVDSKNYVENL